MTNLIVFEELEKLVLDQNWDSLTLFGESDFVYTDVAHYDLLFHSRQNMPNANQIPNGLVIPVIKPYNKNQEIDEIYALNKEHSNLNLFAVPMEDHIAIYEVISEESATIIKPLEQYSVVPEKSFYENVNLSLRRKVQEKRRVIDNY